MPNERRAKRSGAAAAATRTAGATFPPAVLSLACVTRLGHARAALPDRKIAVGSSLGHSANRPQ